MRRVTATVELDQAGEWSIVERYGECFYIRYGGVLFSEYPYKSEDHIERQRQYKNALKQMFDLAWSDEVYSF
jgi:hypothetical protein